MKIQILIPFTDTLPALKLVDFPPGMIVSSIDLAWKIRIADTAGITALAVVTTSPGANQIQQVDENTFRCGSAIEGGKDLLCLVLEISKLPG